MNEFKNNVEAYGSLDDIEKEMNVSYEIVIQALTYGFYFKHEDEIMFSDEVVVWFCRPYQWEFRLFKWIEEADIYISFEHIWISEYGKTWSLNKEDLENKKESPKIEYHVNKELMEKYIGQAIDKAFEQGAKKK